MKLDVGGLKGRDNYSHKIRAEWNVLDWVGDNSNGDIINYNLNSGEPMPIETESVDHIYTSHTLEHVTPDNMLGVLFDLHRILKVDGCIRIVVPDFTYAVANYLRGKRTEGPSKPDCLPDTALGHLMSYFWSPDKKHSHGHNSVFDYVTLHHWLGVVGFRYVEQFSYGRGNIVFLGLDKPKYRNWSLYVEAIK